MPPRIPGVSKDSQCNYPLDWDLEVLCPDIQPELKKTVTFYQKSVIFDGFWRFFEVHTISAEY